MFERFFKIIFMWYLDKKNQLYKEKNKMKILKKLLCYTLSGIMLMSSISTNAFAAEKANNNALNIQKIELPNMPIDTIITSNTDNKETFLIEEDKYLNNNGDYLMLSPMATSLLNVTNYQRKDIYTSYISSFFNSDVTYGITSDLRVYGNSKVYWAGSNPSSYCDKISLTDKFYIAGINPSFAFGSGGSWNVSPGLTNSTATWYSSFPTQYIINHVYDNVDFNGYELYFKQTTTGEFTFGTTTYELSAVDSSTL